MTTKQIIKYANKQLTGFKDVFFFVNSERYLKPYAPNGEKYGIAYANTNKLIACSDNIFDAKNMIDDFISREQELEKEALNYAC